MDANEKFLRRLTVLKYKVGATPEEKIDAIPATMTQREWAKVLREEATENQIRRDLRS